MNFGVSRRLGRAVLGAAVLACGAILTPLSVGGAHADLTVCRTDPVVTLNDGTTVDVSAVIGDTQSDVSGVNFVIMLPFGSQVQSITYPGGQMNNETVTVFNWGAKYAAATFVMTGSSAAVSVTMQVSGAGTDTRTGSSNSFVVNRIVG